MCAVTFPVTHIPGTTDVSTRCDSTCAMHAVVHVGKKGRNADLQMNETKLSDDVFTLRALSCAVMG